MKPLFTFLLLFLFQTVVSQEPETYKILVHQVTSVKGENKKLKLIKGKDRNLLIFKDQKDERLPLDEKDSLKVITLFKRKDKESHDELISLLEKTLNYEIDTIQIPKENKVFRLTDDFFRNRAKLKRHSEKYEDRRIILDGKRYTVKVAGPTGESYIFYAHSPTKESHPEISELVSALQNAYTNYKK